MPTAQEYRQYAEECMESARTAPSREARKQCLDLARLWTRAAQKTDDGMSVPIEADASGPPRPHRSVVLFHALDHNFANLQRLAH